MRLLPRRRSGATLAIIPDRPLLPTESITATVTLDEQVDGVTDARIEIGYVNTYVYEWARGGYTSPGGYREEKDWVPAGSEAIVFAGGTLAAGTHSATIRIPSWAPGSSEVLVEWQARLMVETKGPAPEAHAPFRVLAPPPDPLPTVSRVVGVEDLLPHSITLELTTDAIAYRAGTAVRGVVLITPTGPVTRTASANIRFYRPQISHPLERPPAPRSDHYIRPHTTVAEELVFVDGVTTEIPFAVILPADADPTTEAVHSSLEWWVVATISFAGLTGGIEKVRREIIVYNA